MKNKRMEQLCNELEQQILKRTNLSESAIKRRVRMNLASQSVIKRRVRMNLNESQDEKKRYVHFRGSQIVFVLLAAAVLSCTTVLAISNIDIIRGFFSGETSRIEQDIHEPKASVADDDFRITLEQTLSDDFTTVVIYSVEALNKEAEARLYNDSSIFMTPGAVKFEVDGQLQEARGMGSSLSEYDTDTKRYWSLFVQAKEQLGENVVLETSILGENGNPLTIDLPVDNHMDSYEIPVNLYTDSENPCLVYRIGISNITLLVERENIPFDPLAPVEINIYFKMKDGSIKTKNQLIDPFSMSGVATEAGFLVTERFEYVLDLENVESVIVCDTEFPLHGGEPAPFTVDPALKEVIIGPVFTEGFTLPLAELCEKLDADLNYNERKGIVSVEYRGTNLEVDMKQNVWKLNGKVMDPASTKYYFLERPDLIYLQEGELIMNGLAFRMCFSVGLRPILSEEYDKHDNLNYVEENGRYYVLTP